MGAGDRFRPLVHRPGLRSGPVSPVDAGRMGVSAPGIAETGAGLQRCPQLDHLVPSRHHYWCHVAHCHEEGVRAHSTVVVVDRHRHRVDAVVGVDVGAGDRFRPLVHHPGLRSGPVAPVDAGRMGVSAPGIAECSRGQAHRRSLIRALVGPCCHYRCHVAHAARHHVERQRGPPLSPAGVGEVANHGEAEPDVDEDQVLDQSRPDERYLDGTGLGRQVER